MATLIVKIEDALMERIADTAQERGEDTEQVVIEVLQQAFQPQADPYSEPADGTPTVGDRILAILEPYWAEEAAHPEQFQPGLSVEHAGDALEVYLAQHWAADIRKGS